MSRNLLTIAFIVTLVFQGYTQSLTISDSGQTGTSGTNWSITGTTLTVTGTANIRASVIETALASGNLLIEGNTNNFAVTVNENIAVNTGGHDLRIATDGNTGNIAFNNDLTLNGAITAYGTNFSFNANVDLTTNGDVYLKAIGHIDQQPSVTTTTNGGNIVFWSSSAGGSAGYIRPANIVTNGGHVWMGGNGLQSGTRTWNGLTVGAGYAFSGPFAGVALRGNISTNGGDVLIAGESGETNAGDVAAESTNRTISAGSGDIILMPFSEQLQNVGESHLMVLETTGKISIAPISGGSFFSGQNRTYNGSLSGTTFNGSSALAGVQIPNFANIGGWELGTYSGTGVSGDSPYSEDNLKSMRLDAAFTVAGPIKIKGNQVDIYQNLQTTSANAPIIIKSDGRGTGNDNGWLAVRANANITSAGGDIILWPNLANRVNGTANNELFLAGSNTISSSGGKIVLAGGLDDGSNDSTANDGIPDGFIYRGGNAGSAVFINTNVQILSGGGNIIIRGQQNGPAQAITQGPGLQINSGVGTISIYGLNTSNHGVDFGGGDFAITSASTNPIAILIRGISESAMGYIANWNGGQSLIQNTAATGGGIRIEGLKNGGASTESIRLGSSQSNSTLQILSNTGDISLVSESRMNINNQTVYLGNRKDATSVQGITPEPTAAEGDILIRTGDFGFANTHGLNISTTGTLVVEPFATSFNSALPWPLSNLTLGSNLSGLHLGKENNTADITISTTQTIAGPISVYGGNITLQNSLTSTAANETIKLIASGAITSNTQAKTISTNGGDVIIAADSDGNGNGYIRSFTGALTIDTRAITGGTKSTALTGGGNVILGGENVNATGFASGVSGSIAEGIRIDDGFIVRSGGGDITLRGRSFNGASLDGFGAWGVGFWNGALTLDAGAGKIFMEGIGRVQDGVNSYKQGIAAASGIDISSAFAGSDAIIIKGHQISTSSNWNIGIDFGVLTANQGPGFHKIIASGVGGGITLDGLARDWGMGLRNGIDLVTNDGPITLSSAPQNDGVGGRMVLFMASSQWWGSRSGQYNDIVVGNLTIKSNRFDFFDGVPNIAVAGNVVWEPFTASFGQVVNTNFFNWNQNSQTMTGLTIGKEGNTASITQSTANLTANGPISIFGGDISINENINTTGGGAAGDVLLKGAGDVVLAGSKTITTTGGDVTLWADFDDDGDGYVQMSPSAGIATSGGAITLGGGADIATGYAKGKNITDLTTQPLGSLYISGVHLMNQTSLSSGGGNITLRGQNVGNTDNQVQVGVMGVNATLDAGSGKVAIYGVAGGSGSANAQGISSFNNGWIIRSANTANNAIYLNGDATACNNSATSLGTNFFGTIEATGTNGGITVIGKAGTGTNFDQGLSVTGNILAASGAITLEGDNNNNQQLYLGLGNLTIGAKPSTNVTASTSNVIIRGDQITFNPNTVVTTSGTLTIEPTSDDFGSAFTYPIVNLALDEAVSGLTIGKPSNTSNITFGSATSIAGPIAAYGGTITLDADLTTTNNGNISLFTDNPLGGLSSARTLTTSGAFKYIPRGTSFSADVTYPITNLTATSKGLTIGNATNDKNITINSDVSGGSGIELLGNTININSNLTTTGAGTIMYLKGNTTIAAGKAITSGGNFTHDGNLTFKSDATGTASFGTLGGTFTSVSGLATTERYVPAKRGWRLLTAPLKGASSTTIPNNWQGIADEGLLLFSPSTYQSQTMTGYTTGGGMPNIWKYDSANTQWQSIPNLTNENLFTSTGNNGYLVFATGPSNSTNIVSGAAETTLRPKGELITGDVSHSLTANKYHLIGNPYASPLDTEALVQANSGAKLFMVDPSLGTVGAYVTYDGSQWAPIAPSGSDKYIQSGQGFFVRSASNTTFAISEDHKVVGNSNTWFSRTNSSTNTTSIVESDKIRVLLYKQINAQWHLADGILTVNSATGNNDVDATDTGKMSNFNENISFRNGTSNLAIEYRGLPTIETVQPMRLTGTTVQPYQIHIKTENYNNSNLLPYLEDTLTGTLTNIPINGSEAIIEFPGVVSSNSNPDNRFRIVYQSTLHISEVNTLDVNVFPNPTSNGSNLNVVLPNNLIPASYSITNLLGQPIQSGNLNSIQNILLLESFSKGVYLLKINQSTKKYTTKIIIK